MSNVFPRRCNAEFPVAASGDGVYLIDANNNRYLDGSGGAAVSCLGHSNAAVAAALQAQAAKLLYAHSGFFTTAAAEQLASELAELAPGNINRAYFTSGGSEAVEAALKLARQYFVEIGQPQRRRIIARRQSYHGNTLGALAAGGNFWRRAMFRPLLFDGAEHIEECHYWRRGKDGETAEEYGQRAANFLAEKISALGAETVAAFVAEPVVGATMGAVGAPPGYFRRIREICDEAGILFIADEVMCGMGRTGAWFACEQEEVAPDIVCIAKGVSAGAQPLGAMLCDEKIYAAVANGSGFFQHGHTFSAHPMACAAGVAVVGEIKKHNLIKRAAETGSVLQNALAEKLAAHPNVGDIRGRGLFWGVEFVRDKTNKTPFPPADKIHAAVGKAAFARGLMVYAMGGTIDGESGDHLLVAPPFIISREQIAELADKLAAAVADVLG